jgi:predicted RNA-binding Zn ribbon-like protein
MVIRPRPAARAPWEDGHFVGGHLVLDLTNTVYNRAHPVADNELLKSAADVVTWCQSVGLFEDAPALSTDAAETLATQVRTVRESAWAVFDAVSRAAPIPHAAAGGLLQLSGSGLHAGHLQIIDAPAGDFDADWTAPDAIPAALSMLAAHALFTLPAKRIRACARCGWLFLDSSRGGRRRWCSMSTCGNREKASRHRHAARAER